MAQDQTTTPQKSEVNPLAILASIAHPVSDSVSPPHSKSHHLGSRVFETSEYSFQVTGLLQTNSGGKLTSRLAPNSVGYLLGMRFHINPWEAIGLQFGSSSDGVNYFSPKLGSESLGTTARMVRLTVNEIITVNSATHFEPFFLAGGGVAEFQPKEQTALTPKAQVRGLGMIGAGVDLRFVHMGVRFEIEGLFFRSPDFHNPANPSSWAHVLQPSTGLIFSF